MPTFQALYYYVVLVECDRHVLVLVHRVTLSNTICYCYAAILQDLHSIDLAIDATHISNVIPR